MTARGETVRADDNPEALKKRLDAYHAQTAPLVEFYAGRPTFCRIDGARLVDEVTASIITAVEAAVETLQKISKEVTDKAEIANVGAISAADPEIGAKIAEAVDKVGKDGVITVEESNTFGMELELVEGMRFDKGYISPYFATDAERMEAVLEDPYILLVNSKISAVKDVLPVLEKVMQTGKAVAIIAEDIEGEALATLVVNKIRGTFRSVAIKAPGFGDRRKAMLQDMAILTGGQVISEEVGLKLENATLDLLGLPKGELERTLIGGRHAGEAFVVRFVGMAHPLETCVDGHDAVPITSRPPEHHAMATLGVAPRDRTFTVAHEVAGAALEALLVVEHDAAVAGGYEQVRRAGDHALAGAAVVAHGTVDHDVGTVVHAELRGVHALLERDGRVAHPKLLNPVQPSRARSRIDTPARLRSSRRIRRSPGFGEGLSTRNIRSTTLATMAG